MWYSDCLQCCSVHAAATCKHAPGVNSKATDALLRAGRWKGMKGRQGGRAAGKERRGCTALLQWTGRKVEERNQRAEWKPGLTGSGSLFGRRRRQGPLAACGAPAGKDVR